MRAPARGGAEGRGRRGALYLGSVLDPTVRIWPRGSRREGPACAFLCCCFFRVHDWAAAAQANKARVGKLFARRWRVAVFFGLFTVDNCTRVARVCSTDRQVGRQAARGRSAAATGAPTVCSGEGCGGADNVFVRGRLWEEEGR